MPFTIVRQDLTRLDTDAIVNAANTDLLQGGGVCGAIFKAAGARALQKSCDALAPIHTGQAVLTPGFRLPARYIIHTAGPIYSQHSPEENRRLLEACYRNSLQTAWNAGCRSIAFPLISSGIYGYPKAEALQVAAHTIESFLNDHEMDVILCVFDKSSFSTSKKLMREVESFIDEHYVDQHLSRRARKWLESSILEEPDEAPEQAVPPISTIQSAPRFHPQPELPAASFGSLDDSLADLDKPFADLLFSMIDARGLSDAQVYKKANIDRKLFSKIRTIPGYIPKKKTILALAIALELDQEETERLLERAGYAFSPASKFDIIVQFFIQKRRYNLFELNEVLFQYDQPLLGSL